MRLSHTVAFRLSGLFGFLGVCLGAFGTHALKETLFRTGSTEFWEKAVFYHLVHAAVMLVVAGLRPLPAVAWYFFGAGILAFSGSLYLYALTRVYFLVFITPLGGVCLLVGWLLLILHRSPPTPEISKPL